MKRILFHSFAALLASLGCSYATSVTFSASGGRGLFDASATALPAGDLVWIGTFSTEAFTFTPQATIAQSIQAVETAGGWSQFTLDTSTQTTNAGVSNSVSVGGLGSPKRIAGTITDTNSGATKADFFNNKLIYAWVFNSSSISTATQMGIFRATAGTVAWLFPVNAGGVGDSVTVGTDTTLSSSMEAVGGAGTVTSTTLGLVNAVAAPEPSALAALCGGAGVLAMIRRRRRLVA